MVDSVIIFFEPVIGVEGSPKVADFIENTEKFDFVSFVEAAREVL